jgi:hypothetical protein
MIEAGLNALRDWRSELLFPTTEHRDTRLVGLIYLVMKPELLARNVARTGKDAP